MTTEMTPFSYRSAPPPQYVCGMCGAKNVRLFREYQTMARTTLLTCQSCAELESGKKLDPDHPHSIGWRVAAVPTEDGTTFWGFAGVPLAGVKWWEALPVTPGSPLPAYPLPSCAEIPLVNPGRTSVLEDPRLKACSYVVEATSFERHALWLAHSSTAKASGWGTGQADWSGNGASGWLIQVGTLAGQPVTMDLVFDTINGSIVLFYSGASRVVDHQMLESWLREHVPSYAEHHTDPLNFNPCMQHLTRKR